MSDATESTLNVCGCCESDLVEEEISNVPGQPELTYRISRHHSALRRMMAHLARYRLPDGDFAGEHPLEQLTTRAPADPAIALLDGWATVGHVLSFYQERIANEGYLRTATERRSVLELARSISYELSPGVAAEAYLAFTVDPSDRTPDEVTISAGTQVQSIPAAEGELPQTFETAEDFAAKVWWNALQPRMSKVQDIRIENDEVLLLTTNEKNVVYLKGVNLHLAPGDRMLLVGSGAETVSKRIRSVVARNEDDTTVVTFEGAGGEIDEGPVRSQPSRTVRAAGAGPGDMMAMLQSSANQSIEAILSLGLTESELHVALISAGWAYIDVLDYVAKRSPVSFSGDIDAYVFRESVGIFGHNAPYYLSLPDEIRGQSKAYEHDWDKPDWSVWLDSIKNSEYSPEHLYLERPVSGLTHNSWLVLERPDDYKVYGLKSSREVSMTGFGVSAKVTGLNLTASDGTDLEKDAAFKVRTTTAFVKSEPLNFAAIPNTEDFTAGSTIEIELASLAPGLKIGQPIAITGEQVDAEGVIRSEIKFLASISHLDGYTTLTFTEPLAYGYKRDTVTMNANVVPATHGETVSGEVLGSGDGAIPHQRFKVKKPPLTYVSAATASGTTSTLTLRVDGVAWAETGSLYGIQAEDRKYIIRIDDDGNAFVQFGDGRTGARLPTGSENVTATYRQGIGLSGQVGAGSLTLMKTRPFGVKSVVNPTAASGAEDAETLSDARTNAPLTTITLDRIVSRQDFEDFARAYTGIGKAQAVTLWDGDSEIVYLTIASSSGDPVDSQSNLYRNLKVAIEGSRDPLRSVEIGTYTSRYFNVEAHVLIDPDYVWETVSADIKTVLTEAYSFARRTFSQPVTSAEVIKIIHGVEGVIAVDLEKLHLVDAYGMQVGESLASILIAGGVTLLADPGPDESRFLPAEMLVINEPGISLLEMNK